MSRSVPEALRALHDRALAEFSAGRWASAAPLLGRLALALPAGHALRPTVRATLARALFALGKHASAQRELALALASEPANTTFRELETLLLTRAG